MRIFLTVLILIFSFQSLTKSNDVSEFEIEGMSIGDSLLNYMTMDQINDFEKSYYPGSKKYVRLENNFDLNSKLNIFDKLAFEVLDNDKYILEAVNGILNYNDNIKDCYPKMKEIINDISVSLNKPVTENYVFTYPNGGGKSKVSDFDYSNGSIRIWCTDYSREREKMRYRDHLGLAVQSKKHVEWIKNEAHK